MMCEIDYDCVREYSVAFRKLDPWLCRDSDTGEEWLEVRGLCFGKIDVPLTSMARARDALGGWPLWAQRVRGNRPYFKNLRRSELKKAENAHLLPFLEEAWEDLTDVGRVKSKRRQCGLKEPVVQAMFTELRDLSRSTEVEYLRGRICLDIQDQDRKHHRLTVATVDPGVANFGRALDRYVGKPVETWALEKGLDPCEIYGHICEQIRPVAIANAAAACKRLADSRLWMEREAGRGTWGTPVQGEPG